MSLTQENLFMTYAEINHFEKEPKQAMNRLLQVTLDYYQAKRIHIFSLPEKNKKPECTFEVCGEGIDPIQHSLKNMDATMLEEWKHISDCRYAFYLSCYTANRKDAPVTLSLIKKYLIRSLLVAPLVFKGKLHGFVCVQLPSKNTSDCDALGYGSIYIANELLLQELINVEELHRLQQEHNTEKLRQASIINTLTEDYISVDHIVFSPTLEGDSCSTCRITPMIRRNLPDWEDETSIRNKLDMLLNTIVVPSDRVAFSLTVTRRNVLKALAAGQPFFYTFRSLLDGVECYCELKFIAVRDSSNILRSALLGFRLIDSDYRKRMEIMEQLKKLNGELESAKKYTERIVEQQTEELRLKNLELRKMNEGIVELLGNIVESRDLGSGEHVRRVKGFTYILANQVMHDCPEYGLNERQINLITFASAMHDVGKITVPENILLKPGKLTRDEFEIMKQHCEQGAEILKKMKGFWSEEYLRQDLDICLYHHEKWDGKGYPRGLKGDDIPISAQIVSLADIYDALTSKRVYKEAYTHEKALEMILNGQCGAFSEKMLACLKKCAPHFLNHARDTEKTIRTNLPSQTENKRIKKSYEELQKELNHALPRVSELMEGIPGIFFVFRSDASGELIWFNRLTISLFGCRDEEELRSYTHNSFPGSIHPDDLARIQQTISAQRLGEMHTLEYRIIRKDGMVRMLRAHWHALQSEEYGPFCYIFAEDITELNRLSGAMTISERLVLQQKRLSVLVDRSLNRTESHGYFEGMRFLVADESTMVRQSSRDLLQAEGASVVEAASGEEILHILEKDKAFELILMDVHLPSACGLSIIDRIRDEAEHKIPIIGITLVASSEQVKEALARGMTDCITKPLSVAQLSRTMIARIREHAVSIQKQLENTLLIASTDPLTKVKSVHAYTDMVTDLSRKLLAQEELQYAVVMCDINDLKDENDTHGHDSGDRYIMNCCHILCDVFKNSPVYRVGGDEFIVLLQGPDLKNAKKLMEQLSLAENAAESLPDTNAGRASFAFGIAYYEPENDLYFSDTVKRADAQMYKNKREKTQTDA